MVACLKLKIHGQASHNLAVCFLITWGGGGGIKLGHTCRPPCVKPQIYGVLSLGDRSFHKNVLARTTRRASSCSAQSSLKAAEFGGDGPHLPHLWRYKSYFWLICLVISQQHVVLLWCKTKPQMYLSLDFLMDHPLCSHVLRLFSDIFCCKM